MSKGYPITLLTLGMRNTNPKDNLELLEVFRIGLSCGILDKQEVIQWADSIIEQDAEPDYLLIELSLAGSRSVQDMVSLLQQYIGKATLPGAARVVLGLLYHRYWAGQITLHKVARALEWLAWKTELLDQEKSYLYGMEDDYDLAAEGVYGTVAVVEQEAMRFLKVYQDFRLDNFAEWEEIHATIPNKLDSLFDSEQFSK